MPQLIILRWLFSVQNRRAFGFLLVIFLELLSIVQLYGHISVPSDTVTGRYL